MSAFIPNRRDPEITEKAIDQVKKDKEREVKMGFDGSWVAHPDLVKICKDVFQDSLGSKENQIDFVPNEPVVSEDMLQDFSIPGSTITEEGIRTNIRVGILYIQSWLLGQGAAALYNLMEDAATAEISRSQLWQWLNTESHTDSQIKINKDFIDELISDEVTKIKDIQENSKMIDEAVSLFSELIFDENFEEFLTLPAYNLID
jgi:malate synthase